MPPDHRGDHLLCGATVVVEPGQTELTVTGTVSSGLGTIIPHPRRGPVVEVADGTFSHPISFNTAEISSGSPPPTTPATSVAAYRASSRPRISGPHHQRRGDGPLGLGIYLDQEALDDKDLTDGNDDLATIVQAAVANLDLSTLFDPNAPIASESGYNIYLTDLMVTSTTASLDAIDDGLRLDSLQTILGELFFDCTNFV